MNKKDIEVFSWWKIKFENEKEVLQELRQENRFLTDEGKGHYESWIKQVETVFDQAKVGKSAIPHYVFESYMLETMGKMLADSKIEMTDNNNTRTLRMVIPLKDAKERKQ